MIKFNFLHLDLFNFLLKHMHPSNFLASYILRKLKKNHLKCLYNRSNNLAILLNDINDINFKSVTKLLSM